MDKKSIMTYVSAYYHAFSGAHQVSRSIRERMEEVNRSQEIVVKRVVAFVWIISLKVFLG